MFIVPAQCLGIRASRYVLRREDRPPVQFIVVPAVIELLLDAAAHFEAKIGRDGDIARIEQAMDVAPKQESIGPRLAAVAVGTDMRRFESGRVRSNVIAQRRL